MVDKIDETIREKKISLFLTEAEALKNSFSSLISPSCTGELKLGIFYTTKYMSDK
jgi:hypothetical protein